MRVFPKHYPVFLQVVCIILLIMPVMHPPKAHSWDSVDFVNAILDKNVIWLLQMIRIEFQQQGVINIGLLSELTQPGRNAQSPLTDINKHVFLDPPSNRPRYRKEIHINSYNGLNLLQIASRYSSPEIIHILINLGAEVDFNLDGFLCYKHMRVCATFTDTFPPIYLACRYNPPNVRALIQSGASFQFLLPKVKCHAFSRAECDSTSGGNLLHLAAWYNHYELVEYFLGLSPGMSCQVNAYAETPLHLAVNSGQPRLILPFIHFQCSLSLTPSLGSIGAAGTRFPCTAGHLISPSALAQHLDHQAIFLILRAAIVTSEDKSSESFPELDGHVFSLQLLALLASIRHNLSGLINLPDSIWRMTIHILRKH